MRQFMIEFCGQWAWSADPFEKIWNVRGTLSASGRWWTLRWSGIDCEAEHSRNPMRVIVRNIPAVTGRHYIANARCGGRSWGTVKFAPMGVSGIDLYCLVRTRWSSLRMAAMGRDVVVK